MQTILKRASNLKCMLFVNTNNVQTRYTKPYTASSLKLPLYVFFTYTQCTNYTKCMQMLIEATDVCFLYMQKLCILYFSNFCISKDAIFHSIFATL